MRYLQIPPILFDRRSTCFQGTVKMNDSRYKIKPTKVTVVPQVHNAKQIRRGKHENDEQWDNGYEM